MRSVLAGLFRAFAGDDPEFPYLSFAVGCFHFGADPDTFAGSASEHVNALQEWLEARPEISNVQITDPEISWFENDLPFGLADGGQPLPAITRLRVDFDLDIPPAQQAAMAWLGATRDPLTVSVSIRQGPAVPIAFVCPHTARERPDLAMSLAWHSLKALVSPDEPFALDLRAPSPAHVLGFLAPLPVPQGRETPDPNFGHDRVDVPGARYEVFGFDPRAYPSVEDAADRLFGELEIPAGLYYEIVGAGDRLDGQWDYVTATYRHLVELESASGPVAYLTKIFAASGLLRDLSFDLSEFEGQCEALESRYNGQRRDLDRVIPPLPFMRDELDRELGGRFRFGTARVERPLRVFEQRRLARGQNLVALAAAVVAAVIGATSALWVSAHSGQTKVIVQVPKGAPAGTGPAGTTTGATSTTRTATG